MRLLVIGDFIEDRYVFGSAVRLCPEAPVPVLIPQIRRESPGGAGLVAEQLRELGTETVARYGSFSKKLRYFAGNHLICRVDEDATIAEWDAPIEPSIDYADAIVVSDYGKGAMSEGLARKLVASGKPLFVDAKHHWNWYKHVDWNENIWVFPNEHESFCGLDFLWTVHKLGAKGCRLFNFGEEVCALPAMVSEVVDTTGAGDIFMAGFVYAWTLQLPAEDCLRFANELAGESCRHVGTFVVGKEFAQSVLDRLQSSRESHPPVPGCSLGSILSKPRPQPEFDQRFFHGFERKSDIPISNYSAEPTIHEAVQRILRRAQIPHESPLVPTESPGDPLPTDQESSDEQDRRLR